MQSQIQKPEICLIVNNASTFVEKNLKLSIMIL